MPWAVGLVCIVVALIGLIWLVSMISFIGKLFFIVLVLVLGYEVIRRLWNRTQKRQ